MSRLEIDSKLNTEIEITSKLNKTLEVESNIEDVDLILISRVNDTLQLISEIDLEER